MKKVNYIVVGSGLAGLLFCEILKKNEKSFVVFDDNSQQSSTVAGGLYNPVVLKRFTSVWKAKEQLELALPFYEELENQWQTRIKYEMPVLRLLSSIEEQNNWHLACDKPLLTPFLSPNIEHIRNDHIESKYGYGKVLQTGRIDTATAINQFQKQLAVSKQFYEETFEYEQIIIESECVKYKSICADYIVFAEGFGLKKNPFFKHLPLNGTKGELLTIYAPDLKLDFILKSSVFLIPLNDDHYLVGATYEWDDKSNEVTVKGKNELLNKLRSFLKCDFKIVDHVAGIRPTVVDRRPLVGQHSTYKKLYVLNGLGTRGVMLAPYVSLQLFNLIENQEYLDKEISISRFN